MTVSDAELAWLACAIDGEGNITLYPQRQNGYETYRPVIQVINTHKRFVQRAIDICLRVGASYAKLYERASSDKYRDVFHMQVRGLDSVEIVLSAVQPWLLIKDKFAEDLLLFIKRFRSVNSPFERKLAAAVLRKKHMPRARSLFANEEAPASSEVISCQATLGLEVSVEGVETRDLSPNNNDPQERPKTRFPVHEGVRWKHESMK